MPGIQSTRQMFTISYFWPDWNSHARLGVFHTIFSTKRSHSYFYPKISDSNSSSSDSSHLSRTVSQIASMISDLIVCYKYNIILRSIIDMNICVYIVSRRGTEGLKSSRDKNEMYEQ